MNDISIYQKKKHIVLVIVAHADDETLGMGGTISRHVNNGDIVYGISMTDGVSSRNFWSKVKSKDRINASIKAGNILGLSWIERGNFPDNAMDTVPLLDVIRLIEKVKFKLCPTIIYTHSSADLNIDHRVVCNATITAFRPQPGEIWQEIRTFEIPSATDFGHKSITNSFYPNLYIDIKDTWSTKLAALNEYNIELREPPHSRSIEGIENLAKLRGNQSGLSYAEAFEIIRKIDR
jgi:LmbE family N-acetylglucosaminyl deacetylase